MPERKSGGILETLKTLVYAVAIALTVRTFLFEPFNIPSGSMKPTLLVGDYLFVSKFAYGYSRYSLPLGLPLFSGRIMGSLPERGDVVVFKLPSDNKTDYIKRVVGLPGDRIQVRDGLLYINDVAVKIAPAGDFDEDDDGRTMPGADAHRAAAQRARASDPRSIQLGQPRQHGRLRGPAGSRLRHGRQPRQLTGQSGPECRVHPGPEPDRPCRAAVLLGQRRGAGSGSPGPGRWAFATGACSTSSSSGRRAAAPSIDATGWRWRPSSFLGAIEAALGYSFRDPGMLDEALTHGSVLGANRSSPDGPMSGSNSWATACWA